MDVWYLTIPISLWLVFTNFDVLSNCVYDVDARPVLARSVSLVTFALLSRILMKMIFMLKP